MLRRNPRGQVEDKISSAINKDNDEHHGLFGGKKKKVPRAHQTLLGTCCATAAPDTSRLQQKQVSGDGLLPWENNKPSDDKWLNNDVSALPASAAVCVVARLSTESGFEWAHSCAAQLKTPVDGLFDLCSVDDRKAGKGGKMK